MQFHNTGFTDGLRCVYNEPTLLMVSLGSIVNSLRRNITTQTMMASYCTSVDWTNLIIKPKKSLILKKPLILSGNHV